MTTSNSSRNRAARLAALATGLMFAGMAQAEAPPLRLEELRRCASQVQQLRSGSAVLTAQSQRIELERNQINQRTAALSAEDVRLQPDNLKAGLDLHERRQRNQAEAQALNARLDQLRRQIDELNLLKADYDRGCSNRPYRRADLDTLPEPARAAMRSGMADVQVPYIDPASIPPR